MLGKIVKNICILLIGMLLGIGALAGFGYLALKNVKLGTITEKLEGGDKLIGEELKDYSVLDAVKVLSDKNNTLGKLIEYVPALESALNGAVNNGDIGKFVSIDLDKLKDCTVADLGGNLGKAVSVVLSLDGITEAFGVELPSAPIFTTRTDYVKITDETFEIQNTYYKSRKENIYYKTETEYIAAYAEGELKPEAANKDLYFYGKVAEMPLTDALGIIGSALNLETLTVKDMKDNFGVDLIGDGTGIVAKLISEEDKVADISSNLQTRIDTLKLSDVLGNDGGGNPILDALVAKETTVGNLSAAVSDLTVQEVFPTSVFVAYNAPDDPMRFEKTADGVYAEAAEGGYQIADNAGVWLFIIYDRTGAVGNFTYTEKEVKLIDVANNMAGINERVKNATMLELWEIGFLDNLPSESLRNKKLGDVLAMIP